MTERLNKTAVLLALTVSPDRGGPLLGRYKTRTGDEFVGLPVSQVPAALRAGGWRNVSRVDYFDLRDAGLELREAQYVGGARPTGRYVECVRVREVGPRAD